MWDLAPLRQVRVRQNFKLSLILYIRSELFCDGNVNCAVGSQLPPGLPNFTQVKVKNKIQLCEKFSIFISSVIVLDPIYF